MTRKINAAALELVKQFEGLSLDRYKCAAGVTTIGYGHTGGKLPKACTLEEAENWLIKDISGAAKAVTKLVDVELNDAEFGALVSFVFNIGSGNFSKDSVLRKLNDGDHMGAANDLWMWRRDKSPKDGGVILRGLQERRSAERHLFLTGGFHGRATGCYLPGRDLFYDGDD